MKDSVLKRLLLIPWFALQDAQKLHYVRKNYGVLVMSAQKTVKYIQQNNCSVARFGDGEFSIMLHKRGPGFQKESDALADAMINIFNDASSNLLICLPFALSSTKGFNSRAKQFWEGWARENQKAVVQAIRPIIGQDYRFGDSYISRPYTAYKSRKYSAQMFSLLKTLWLNKDILIVEGAQTRLGISNDLFDNAKSIKRILCPAENAFDVYDRILTTTLSCWRGELVILALGPTATVLASDLSKSGVQALDLGHIDIQYGWYLTGTSFAPVKGKYTNEAHNGNQVENCEDETYLSQIIAEVK